MSLYPGAQVSDTRAKRYGPLPTHGMTGLALVMHSTETRGMPGFNGGATAPHYTYDPRWQSFREWLDPADGYVGTLTGHTQGGHLNCKAIQLEIICYSSRDTARRVDGIWIGDLTHDDHYNLASFYEWCINEHQVGDMVTLTPEGGWKYGTLSPLRMSRVEWQEFDGLTAHGAIPGTRHWDTGILDLNRIHSVAMNDTPTAPPVPADPTVEGFDVLKIFDGYKVNLHLQGQVMAMQALLKYHDFHDENTSDRVCGIDGKFGSGTKAALIDFQRSRNLTADGICGADTWAALRLARR